MAPTDSRGARTIRDFGDQWQRYQENRGYYASVELLGDILEPLVPLESIVGRRVLEIGSGTGRIAELLLRGEAASVIAVEPSEAFEVLKQNVAEYGDRVELHRVTGDSLPSVEVDLVVSIGVIHHIPDPEPVVHRAWEALRPGGRVLIWVYGHEGNELYLSLLRPMRAVTSHLPDTLLAAVSHALNLLLTPYMLLCRFVRLPLHGYFYRVLGRFGWRERSLVIFDQLNPCYARYYKREEAEALLTGAGFVEVRSHHRHGYSWTVTGIRPMEATRGELHQDGALRPDAGSSSIPSGGAE